MQQADWIAADWGTTNLRVWAMQGTRPVDQAQSDQGMNRLKPDQFEAALLALVEPWLAAGRTTRVMCCGMAGSRQGWTEAAYLPVPTRPDAAAPTRAPVLDNRIDVHLLPGLSQSDPADVMRGEETQIAGFLSLNQGWDGVICLPGTHTKWVHVSAEEVVSFQTFMTGELFGLLADHSVLRHSVTGDGFDAEIFADAVATGMSHPQSLAARLFRLRAAHLLDGASATTLRSELSGLLVGVELAAARPYWLGQQVAVIGSQDVANAYVAALHAQGLQVTETKAEAMTLAGLTAAHSALISPA